MNLYQKKKQLDGLINTTRVKISQGTKKQRSLVQELDELLLARDQMDRQLQCAIIITQDQNLQN